MPVPVWEHELGSALDRASAPLVSETVLASVCKSKPHQQVLGIALGTWLGSALGSSFESSAGAGAGASTYMKSRTSPLLNRKKMLMTQSSRTNYT